MSPSRRFGSESRVRRVRSYITIIADESRAVSHESDQMRLGLPEFLHWNPEHDSSSFAHDDNVLCQLHLDFLYSNFLLYRILNRRTQTQSDGIIKASRDILSALLQMVAKKNRARKPPVNIGWDVSILRGSNHLLPILAINQHYSSASSASQPLECSQ